MLSELIQRQIWTHGQAVNVGQKSRAFHNTCEPVNPWTRETCEPWTVNCEPVNCEPWTREPWTRESREPVDREPANHWTREPLNPWNRSCFYFCCMLFNSNNQMTINIASCVWVAIFVLFLFCLQLSDNTQLLGILFATIQCKLSEIMHSNSQALFLQLTC